LNDRPQTGSLRADQGSEYHMFGTHIACIRILTIREISQPPSKIIGIRDMFTHLINSTFETSSNTVSIPSDNQMISRSLLQSLVMH